MLDNVPFLYLMCNFTSILTIYVWVISSVYFLSSERHLHYADVAQLWATIYNYKACSILKFKPINGNTLVYIYDNNRGIAFTITLRLGIEIHITCDSYYYSITVWNILYRVYIKTVCCITLLPVYLTNVFRKGYVILLKF